MQWHSITDASHFSRNPLTIDKEETTWQDQTIVFKNARKSWPGRKKKEEKRKRKLEKNAPSEEETEETVEQEQT
jgi:hypothetical protein